MRKSVRSLGVFSGLIEVGGSLSNKTSPAKVTILFSALAGILAVQHIKRHCHFDEKPVLRFEPRHKLKS